MKIKHPRTVYVELEPGDATLYKFLVSDMGKSIVIASLNTFRFDTIQLDMGSIESFFLRCGSPPGYDLYSSWACNVLSDQFLVEVREETSSNPYTALASLICARVIWST